MTEEGTRRHFCRATNASSIARENLRLAKRIFSRPLPASVASSLRFLSKEFSLSLGNGELKLIDASWYVTHTGLLRLARRKKCSGISVEAVDHLCDPTLGRFVFKATVFPSKNCRGFVGYGDADPSNVSPLVRGAEMRVAETRAVNRALRKAYGIGLCSVEELGARDRNGEPMVEAYKRPPQSSNGNGNSNGGPRVRDRLCQLIRQHQLDPEQVKAYAVDFCGTSTLKEASRSQVEQFVQHLADWADRDRDALLCQLNSHALIGEKEKPKDGAA